MSPFLHPESEARPVDAPERVVLMDVLRGFALGGVFVSNSFTWFSGRVLLPRAQSQALAAPPLEAVVSALHHFFVNQKFVTLFSFLFGLGFSIQLARAGARGVSLAPLYSRRLGILLGIGLMHLFGPLLMHGAKAAAEATRNTEAREARVRADFLEALAHGSVWATQEANARYSVYILPQTKRFMWMCIILGRFLLGLLAGRHLLLQDVERRRAWHHWMLGWGLAVGVLGNTAGLVVQRLRAAGLVEPTKNPALFLMTAVQEWGYLGLAAVYVAAFALLFQRARWRRVMEFLAPVGRMALTLYLLQSLVNLWIYDGWGLGLIGRLPPSQCIALSLAVFALQLPLAHAWLSRFRFGPAEWVGRSLTYGRAQPMRVAGTNVSELTAGG